MPEQGKFRPGVRATVWPTTPSLLLQKTYRRFNILVGDDQAQVRFAEQVLGLPCKFVEILHDEDLLGKEESLLYRVESLRCLELSPNTKALSGIWCLDPIEKGSAGANAIVKYAASLLDVPADTKLVQRVADQLLAKEIGDIRAAIWDAACLLVGPPPLENKERWPDPWEKPIAWMPEGVDPGLRLNTLYRFLVGYTFAKEGDQDAARKFGISVAKFKVMQRITLDLNKVYSCVGELSKWRAQKYPPLVCALRVTNIWNPGDNFSNFQPLR
jgi:hypothetical protein